MEKNIICPPLDVAEPITKPVVQIRPSSGAVEYVDNMTMTCQVKAGTRLLYHWLKNGKPLRRSPAYSFSPQNNTFQIAPVTKEDAGNYTCLVKNPVSEMESDIIAPTIYCKFFFLMSSPSKGSHRGHRHGTSLGYCSSRLVVITPLRHCLVIKG